MNYLEDDAVLVGQPTVAVLNVDLPPLSRFAGDSEVATQLDE